MPGAPQLITQTIPLTEVLIGVVSNVENAKWALATIDISIPAGELAAV